MNCRKHPLPTAISAASAAGMPGCGRSGDSKSSQTSTGTTDWNNVVPLALLVAGAPAAVPDLGPFRPEKMSGAADDLPLPTI